MITDTPRLSKRILSPYAPAILSALQCQGNTSNCGPYTTATVLNAMQQKSLDGAILAEELNKISWNGIIPVVRRIPNNATFPWGMVDVFRKYKMRASWSMFSSVDNLIKCLENGDIQMPIIGKWKPIYAHVMTLIAWDEEDGFGFANTQYTTKEIFWIKAEEFTQQWKAMGSLLVRIQHDR